MTAPNSIPSPVVYKDVPGYIGYRVGDDGSVWTCRMKGCIADRVNPGKWRPLRSVPDKEGYQTIILSRDGKVRGLKVHRLVLEAFVGPCPDGHECRHLNGIPGDNRLANLRWGTHVENESDKRAHGTVTQVYLKGVRNGRAKLTERDVLAIRELRSSGHTLMAIAPLFGVTYSTVQAIVARKKWGHIR